MVSTLIALSAVQAAGSAVHAAINAYLSNPPRPSFSESSGNETTFDQDNWARILDTHAVLFLVRPLISGIQTINLDDLRPSEPTASQGGRRLGTDQENLETPPPYTEIHISDPRNWLSSAAYEIIRTSQRLVETLTIASTGPTGSTPLAWNLHVSASVETSIELLALYRSTTSTMSAAPAGSMLNQVYLQLNLQDEELLLNAERAYRSIPVGAFGSLGRTATTNKCQLRQPSSQLCLSLPAAQTRTITAWDRTKDGILWTSALVVGGAVAGAALGTYQYVSSKKKAAARKLEAQPKLARQGAGCETLVFEKAEDNSESAKDRSCTSVGILPGQDALRFGMLVKLGALAPQKEQVSTWLKGSAASEPAALRILHCDERYRDRGISRAIIPGDRIILKEESTGKLLGMKKMTEDQWEIDFGVSDDVLWRVGLPL